MEKPLQMKGFFVDMIGAGVCLPLNIGVFDTDNAKAIFLLFADFFYDEAFSFFRG
jgi:hypothetical protein